MKTDCIEWTHSRNKKDGNRLDYGQVRRDGKMRKAHRVAWEESYGPIPDGALVLHTCDNPPCVNPAHLYLGSHSDNAKDRERRGRGRDVVGSRNGHSTITEQTAIRVKMMRGVLSASLVSRVLGISINQVCQIMNGKAWKHVTAQTRYC